MALFDFINRLIYSVLFFLAVIDGIISYEKILLEESRLCKYKPDDPEASIYLEKEKGSSKIVTQKKYFAEWTGRYNFRCSFSVRAPKNYGIYAVIQVLNFRKNAATQHCEDYVQFSIPQPFLSFLARERKYEKHICGKIYAAQTHVPDSVESDVIFEVSPVAQNSFVAPEGHLHVTIYIAQQRLLKDEKLEVKIAFTSYKQDCKKRSKHIECRKCEWIWEGLKNDHVQNCPYTSCLDENGCKDLESPFVVYDVISNETGTKVTVVAISAIMITFFIFAICLCGCRRSQRCCWQVPQNNSVRVEMNRTRPNTRDECVTTFHEVPSNTILPSAPALNDIKDVPPSYESLFPSK